MRTPLKLSLIIMALVTLVGLACLVWFLSRRNEPGQTIGPSIANTSRVPTFEVNVEKPRMDRPFAGILPAKLEAYLIGGELKFDNTSRGARVSRVEPNHIELSAEDWDLLIETDAEGKITQGTRLVFPIEIANVQWTLRCRPADPAVGFLNLTTRPATSQSQTSPQSKTTDLLDGQFIIELARCEDSKTGKTLDTEAGGNPGNAWPSSPLTLRGNFAVLTQGHR